MINYHSDIAYSEVNKNKRMNAAQAILGKSLVFKIITFVLYLLGGKREEIAKFVGISPNTLLSVYDRVNKYGLLGFVDRRKNNISFLSDVQKTDIDIDCKISKNNSIILNYGNNNKAIKISKNNPMQFKILLLTLFENKIISRKDVADELHISCSSVDKQLKKIKEGDVISLLDKRHGQTKDYVFTPNIKGELIQQIAANVATGKKSSSKILSEDLKKRCNLDLSSRTIRYHIEKLGLSKIKKTLPNLIRTVKKT